MTESQVPNTIDAPPTPNQAVEAFLDRSFGAPAVEPPANEAKPDAPPPPPEPAKVETPKPTVDPEAVRRQQERTQAELHAKFAERERAIAERESRLKESESAVARARRLEQLAKDDGLAFLRETGRDPVAFTKDLADRQRLSDAARTEIDGTKSEIEKVRAELARIETERKTAEAEATKAARMQAFAQLSEIAKAKHAAAAHFLDAHPGDPYIDSVADELRAEKGYQPSLEQIAERVDLRVTEQARTILATPWGRTLAAEILKVSTTAPTAPSGQEAKPAQKSAATLTNSVASDRTPPRDDAASRRERALDRFLGGE